MIVRLGNCLLATVALLAVVAASASAALPGRNGKIGYVTSMSSAAQASSGPSAWAADVSETWLSSVWMSGKGDRELFNPGDDPAFSPKGKKVVFSDPYDGGLYIGRADGRRKRRLTRGYDTSPDFSPGGRIVFERQDVQTAVSEIRIYGRHRSHRIGFGSDPAWSSRGRISFVGDLTGERPAIYTMRPDGSDVRYVVDGSQPDWSPSGSRLVFVTRSGRLALIRSSGKGLRRLTRRRGYGAPTFSPDGRYLAVVRKGLLRVIRVRTRRSHAVPITDEDDLDYSLDWQPLPRHSHR